jgi:hypothetical protein
MREESEEKDQRDAHAILARAEQQCRCHHRAAHGESDRMRDAPMCDGPAEVIDIRERSARGSRKTERARRRRSLRPCGDRKANGRV